MSNYVRKVDGYRYTQTETETSGTEVYILDDGHPAAVPEAQLPVVGTTLLKNPAGQNVAYCYCRSKVGSYVGYDTRTIVYTFEFSTQDKNVSTGGSSVNTDKNNMRLDLGTLAYVCKQGFTYSDGAGGAIKDPIQRVLPTGSFTLPRGPMTAGENSSWWTNVVAKIGKINSLKFTPQTGMEFRKGSVLFEGINGGTIYENAVLKWQWEMRFAFLIVQGLIRGGAVAITEDDWQFIPADDGKFSRTTPAIYQTTDFDPLKQL